MAGTYDAIVALSESGVKILFDRLILLEHISRSGGGTWGPFSVGYTANVTLSSTVVSNQTFSSPPTTLTLINAPANKVQINNLRVSGSVGTSFAFDLSSLLPDMYIPPVQYCIHIPFVGTVCTPQIHIHFGSVGFSVTLPFAVDVSAQFGINVVQKPTAWEVGLLVTPFSLFIDPTPMIAIITSGLMSAVNNTLGAIPLIGPLIAGFVNYVLSVLNTVLTTILSTITTFIRDTMFAIDLLSPTIPIKLLSFSKTQVMLPAAGLSDPEVDLVIEALNASILNNELVTTAIFA